MVNVINEKKRGEASDNAAVQRGRRWRCWGEDNFLTDAKKVFRRERTSPRRQKSIEGEEKDLLMNQGEEGKRKCGPSYQRWAGGGKVCIVA